MKTIHERSWVEIDLTAFRSNLRYLKSFMHSGQQFMQIVKADAYGHGACDIAEVAISEGADYLGVANLEEGKLLRLQGITCPILILSPCLEAEIPAIVEYNLVPSVSDILLASAFSSYVQGKCIVYPIHVKIDTGMHRSGVDYYHAKALIRAINCLQNLIIEGLYSHFASAENDVTFSKLQETAFYSFVEELSVLPKYVHLSNSAALINGLGIGTNLVRIGIMSFGIDTLNRTDVSHHLKPVMTFKSKISTIKSLNVGDSVGYSRTWTAQRPSEYCIVPIGYADGYDFLFSNKGVVEIRGYLCQVIGRVSMDMITIDTTDVPQTVRGDEVVLLGNGKSDLRVEKLCALYGGSPYELLCQVGRRAKRFYMDGKDIIHSTPIARRDFVSSDFNDSKLNQIISSAIAQRLQNEEIGELVYKEIFRNFFSNKDRDIHYRSCFRHSIEFIDSESPDFYIVKTILSYKKKLARDYFQIVCANTDEQLRKYLSRPDVEYRWLLDSSLKLDNKAFEVQSVYVNGIQLEATLKVIDGCFEVRCSHETLSQFIDREVLFEIQTSTLYPKSKHQLSIFVAEPTKGIDISFKYPSSLMFVEPVTVFSGQNQNPCIERTDHSISIRSYQDEWIFPLSGVVFTY